MVCAADVDELNLLAARREQLDPAEVGKLNAALQQKDGLANIGQVIDFTYNVDFYVHIPEVHNYLSLIHISRATPIRLKSPITITFFMWIWKTSTSPMSPFTSCLLYTSRCV